MESTGENDCDCGTSPVLPDGYCRSRSIYAGRANKRKPFHLRLQKKSTGELHALGLRTLQSEDFSKMQSTVCATKQLYIRDFEVSYKNASGGKKKKRKVLDISDLMIPQGSVVGVVGNNGAGKTTFANNLCGLLKTAKGDMSMDGKLIWQIRELRPAIWLCRT